MSMTPRLLAATLAFVPLTPGLASAAPAAGTAPAPAAPAVQRPTSGPTEAVGPAGSPDPAPNGAQGAPGVETASATPELGVPVAPAGEAGGGDPSAAPPADPGAGSGEAAAPPGLAEQLLGPLVNRHPSERAPGRVRSEEESAEQEDAAIASMYRTLFRPPSNPGRFNAVVRGVYMIAGSADSTMSGRLGGITADLGQSFNKVGYAVTLAAHFGSLLHTTKERETQTIALLGGGPTINLGRLALLQRGFLDARLGYDFFVAPTRLIVDNMAMADGIRAPHGPRFSLNMGLLSNPARARKLFHGFGLTIGYQALVGSLKGDLPFTNVLQFGIVYWGG